MEKSPTYIKGHWRNKRDAKSKSADESAVMAGLLVASVIAIVLIMFWKVTVSVAASVAVAYGIRRYLQYRSRPDQLVIHRYK